MSQELLYTSVPPGVIPGKRGYCTVARTADVPGRIALLLEQSLSDYRYSAEGNPAVVWTHLRVGDGLRESSVLTRKTRINDHSGRPSVFAHHVLLGPEEQPQGGPAWVMGQERPDLDPPEFLLPEWDGRVGTLPAGRTPKPGDRKPARCKAWEDAGVDPGWAGALAEAFLSGTDPSYVIAPHDWDLLPLIEDAVALLPESRRWALTFSTYFTGLPPNIPCAWRFVLPDSAEAKQAARLGRGLLLDLQAPGEPPGGVLVDCARSGKRPPRVRDQSAPGLIRPGRPRRAAGALVDTSRAAESLEGLDLDDLASGSRSGANRQLAAIGAVAGAILLLGGFIIWYVGRTGEPDPEPADAVAATPAPVERPKPAPEVAEVEPKSPAPRIEPVKEAPREVVKAATEPDPATAPFGETRTASVRLPDASDAGSRHDSADTVLDVPLPSATRFALRLRGLDDAGMQAHKLVARPSEPGRSDALTVVHASKGKDGPADEARVVARFRVEGGKLHFRWTEELASSLVAPAGGLRDCVLEVKGGGTRVNVVLRPAAVDPLGLTVKQGKRDVDWKPSGGRPVRALVIQACEVEDGAGGWDDVPRTESPLRRARRLRAKGEKASDGAEAATLEVGLSDNAALWPKLEPALAKAQKQKARLTNGTAKQKAEVKKIDTNIKNGNARYKELQVNIRSLDSRLKSAQLQLKGFQESLGVSRDPDSSVRLGAMNQVINETIAELNDNNAEFRNLEKLLAELTAGRNEIRESLDPLEAELASVDELVRRLEPYDEKRKIRVKLGMVVDGETVEVGRVGPW